jgi:hypothetical protein
MIPSMLKPQRANVSVLPQAAIAKKVPLICRGFERKSASLYRNDMARCSDRCDWVAAAKNRGNATTAKVRSASSPIRKQDRRRQKAGRKIRKCERSATVDVFSSFADMRRTLLPRTHHGRVERRVSRTTSKTAGDSRCAFDGHVGTVLKGPVKATCDSAMSCGRSNRREHDFDGIHVGRNSYVAHTRLRRLHL